MSQTQSISSGGCGCLLVIVLLVIVFFILGFTSSWWWFVIAISVVLFVLGLGISANELSGSSSSSSTNKKDSFSSYSINSGVSEDIQNTLIELSKGEIKDPVTQEVFRPGETVHLCLVHKLAYHEDSWKEIGCKCDSCGNDAQTKIYTLPVAMEFDKKKVSQLIDFRDIDK